MEKKNALKQCTLDQLFSKSNKKNKQEKNDKDMQIKNIESNQFQKEKSDAGKSNKSKRQDQKKSQVKPERKTKKIQKKQKRAVKVIRKNISIDKQEQKKMIRIISTKKCYKKKLEPPTNINKSRRPFINRFKTKNIKYSKKLLQIKQNQQPINIKKPTKKGKKRIIILKPLQKDPLQIKNGKIQAILSRQNRKKKRQIINNQQKGNQQLLSKSIKSDEQDEDALEVQKAMVQKLMTNNGGRGRGRGKGKGQKKQQHAQVQRKRQPERIKKQEQISLPKLSIKVPKNRQASKVGNETKLTPVQPQQQKRQINQQELEIQEKQIRDEIQYQENPQSSVKGDRGNMQIKVEQESQQEEQKSNLGSKIKRGDRGKRARKATPETQNNFKLGNHQNEKTHRQNTIAQQNLNRKKVQNNQSQEKQSSRKIKNEGNVAKKHKIIKKPTSAKRFSLNSALMPNYQQFSSQALVAENIYTSKPLIFNKFQDYQQYENLITQIKSFQRQNCKK